MPSILIIDKNSVVKPYNTKTFVEDELYKKAGFKSKEGFAKHSEWTVRTPEQRRNEDVRGITGEDLSSKVIVALKNAPTTIELYGKTTGRAGQENKYDFPPPADNILFFGSCVLVCKSGNNVVDISLAEWEKIYERLFGGFDDIHKNDSEDDEEDDDSVDDNVPRTKEGYVKDGFIVDDTEESDESEYEPVAVVSSKSKPAKQTTPRKTKPFKTAKTTEKQSQTQELSENIQIKIHPEIIVSTSTPIAAEEDFDPTYFSCTDELVEESYI